MNGATGLGEQVLDFGIVEEFTPLIHANTFTTTWGVASRKKVFEPKHRCGLGDLRVTMCDTSEVVGDRDPGRFPIDALAVFLAFRVGRAHTQKGEVNGQPLVWKESFLCMVKLRFRRGGDLTDQGALLSRLGLLGPDTGWTGIKDRGCQVEPGLPCDCSPSIVQALITWMAKALVPQEAFSLFVSMQDIGRECVVQLKT